MCYEYNSLNIKLCYKDVIKLIKLTWFDLYFGIKNNFFNLQDAVAKANNEFALATDKFSEDVFLITIEDEEEEIIKHINNLIKQDQEKNLQKTKNKYIYILSDYIYNNKEKFDDPLLAISYVWEDFGLPKEIEEIIYFLPKKNINNSKDSDGKTRLFEKWREYLHREKYKYL